MVEVEVMFDVVVTVNGDGTTTVAHNRGTLVDGVDTVRHFERLQFADVTEVVSGSNTPATGTVSISDTTPTEDQVLTAAQPFARCRSAHRGTQAVSRF